MSAVAKKKLISVITVCKNSSETIGDTLKSVSVQKNVSNSIEHIIIDGLSTDGTLSIVRKYPNVLCFSEEDNGISDAFNKGVKKSTGEWLVFLNSDDYFSNDSVLEQVSKVLASIDDRYSIVYGQIEMISQNKDISMGIFGRSGLEKLLYLRMVIPHQATFMRRKYFDKYGLFDSTYNIGMDYELLLRGFRKEIFLFYPHIISTMRVGGVAMSSGREVLKERMHAQLKHKVGGVILPYILRLYFEIRRKIFTKYSIFRFVSPQSKK